MENLPRDVQRSFDELARDPKYQHFARIPDRIIQCIDYFGIECDRQETRSRLLSYYLFIGVVDDAIDSGRIDAGRSVLDYLSSPTPVFGESARRSSLRLISEILKTHLAAETYPAMIDKLRELSAEVAGESAATSIESYIAHRRAVGSLTAESSLVLIRPALSGEHGRLLRFMKEVGAVGCLIDSLIDLGVDRRLGLLGFNPGFRDYAKLSQSILGNGLRLSLKHPGLFGLFLRAIIDNVRDRFRSQPDLTRLVSDRKDEAASVA